jgi:uncharacterized protein (DUF4415 family)
MRKEYDFSKGKLNPYVKGKRPVTIRLDVAIVHWLMEESKRQGLRGYQTLANAILAQAMAHSGSESEQVTKETVRQIVREELKKKRA